MQAVVDWFSLMFSSPAQFAGFVALVIAVLAFQQRERRGILRMQIASIAFWSVHMLWLGAWAGGMLNALSLVRTVVYYNKGRKKWATGAAWPIGFLVAFTAATVVTIFFLPGSFPWWYNLFPLAGAYVFTLATYSDSAKLIRRTLWISSVVWIFYNAQIGSVAGIVAEGITLVSEAIAILRFDVLGRKEPETK